MTDIQFALGDRKIDIVTVPFNPDSGDVPIDASLIIKNARKEGILLLVPCGKLQPPPWNPRLKSARAISQNVDGPGDG